jgi:hypothetical protein
MQLIRIVPPCHRAAKVMAKVMAKFALKCAADASANHADRP